MKEIIWILFDEIIINCIVMIRVIFIAEILDFFSIFLDLTILIFEKIQDFHRIVILVILFPLNYRYFCLWRNHANHDGSLNPEKDIISCDNLCIDFALCKCIDGRLCIRFELIYESNNPHNICVCQEFFSSLQHVLLYFCSSDLLITKTNASVSRK